MSPDSLLLTATWTSASTSNPLLLLKRRLCGYLCSSVLTHIDDSDMMMGTCFSRLTGTKWYMCDFSHFFSAHTFKWKFYVYCRGLSSFGKGIVCETYLPYYRRINVREGQTHHYLYLFNQLNEAQTGRFKPQINIQGWAVALFITY